MTTYRYYNNELYHYGIKGQKWGVRRYQNKDGTLTYEGKKREEQKKRQSKKHIFTKRNIAIGAAAVGASLAVIGAMYVYKKRHIPMHIIHLRSGHKVDINKLATDDLFIPKGKKFQRISSKSIEDYADKGRSIYVSYLKKDNRIYKTEMPKFIRKWGANGVISDDGKNAYVHKLIAKNDIKAPSKKLMAELYMKATGSSEVDEAKYKNFMQRLANRDNPAVKKFFDLVQEQGYNAVIDENDAGNYTKSPLILLNPGEDILSSKSHRINRLEKVIDVILR